MSDRIPTHKPAAFDDVRPSRQRRGYGAVWQRLRKMVLRRNPACECGQPATEVDHLDGDTSNTAAANLVARCKPCHSRKTVAHDGGLGRPVERLQ